MPQPGLSSVHSDKFLTNMSLAYAQEMRSFAYWQAGGLMPVAKQSDSYVKYDKHDWMRDAAQLAALGSPAQRGGYDISTGSYSCSLYELAHYVPDQIKMNADQPIDVIKSGVQWLTQQMMIKAEVLWTSNLFASSKWATDSTPSSTWDVQETSTPIEDVKTGRITIQKATGQMPNVFILGMEVYEALKIHPEITELVKYITRAGS